MTPTNRGYCPVCGSLLTGIAGLCYATVEDYVADYPHVGVERDKIGVTFERCMLCGRIMKGKATMKEPWPEDRRKEFAELLRLVRMAGELNYGSNVAGRILVLDNLVRALCSDDQIAPRESFMSWLEKEATGQ